MKSKIQRMLSILIIMLMVVISVTKELPVQQVQASVTSEGLAHTYFNVICKYLDLGKNGKNKFDFNIKKNALQKGATYSWYIKADKGNPEAVIINSKTGVVTAKSVGTAYIRCKITLVNKTVLRPEAKVIVRNNITSVAINNVPEAGILNVGATMDFNHSILNTDDGKYAEVSGIIRWEIKNDTAGVGNVTEEGVVIPKRAGEFSIRAICFQSIKDYKLWLINKEVNNYITAKSDWVTISVTATNGEAATQEQLNELLIAEKITQITITSDVKSKIVIPKGDYSDKTLIVNAPNSEITNNGVFKFILIKSASNTIWEERAVNNSLMIQDSEINLIITEKANVKSIEFGLDSATSDAQNSLQSQNINEEAQIQSFTSDTDIVLENLAYFTINGTIEELSVSAASKLIISGSGSISKFTIKEKSIGTMVATSITLDLVAYSDFTITLLKGAEASTIRIPSNTTGTIENLSESAVDIYFRTGFILLTSNYAIYIPSTGTHKLLGKISTSSVIKYTPSLVSAVTGSAINAGQSLWYSILNGTFIHNSSEVNGTLSWDKPETIVNSTEVFKWTFIPSDTSHFNTVTGFSRVVIIEEILPILNVVKAAVDSANYTNLYVSDTSSSIVKLFAVRSVIENIKGVTTVDVIWNSTSSTYDVTISYNSVSITTSITTATFVNVR